MAEVKKAGDGPPKEVDVFKILDKAAKSAFRGGTAGAAAMGINVFALMWMRTTINYQYRYGTSMTSAMRTLYADGGIFRFYRGVGFALIQGPWSRFGDTAANTGAIELLNAFDSTKDLSGPVKTLGASAAAAAFRMISTPIDTCKTIMQVEGRSGLTKLHLKYTSHGGFPRGLPQLWHGAYGTVGATFIGHYPWFATYNFLQDYMPKDGYVKSISLPIDQKLISNGVSGMMFSVLWKLIDDRFKKLFG
ncbi:mitochondrial carrier domain-containing protein [Pavlovales sp. CCMP2436]|nr:mitochondrial carrier domain-containing protein [Pavlovales sp. CCMP2436]